jgi:hypothetical protein
MALTFPDGVVPQVALKLCANHRAPAAQMSRILLTPPDRDKED